MIISDKHSACCMMIALKLADNWEENSDNLLEGSQLIPDGKVHYSINHVPEIEVLIELKSGKSYKLKTPPITFLTKDHQFLFLVQYDNQKEIAEIRLNTTIAASTEPDFIPPPVIQITTKANDFIVDMDSYKQKNEEKRRKRKEEVLALEPKSNQRLRTFEERLDLLVQEIELMKLMISVIQQGHSVCWMPLTNSIRKMICRMKGEQHVPLLQRVAGFLDMPLLVYSNPIDVHLIVDSQMSGWDIHLSLTPDLSCQTEVDLDCWLDFNHLVVQAHTNTKKFSNNDILCAIANTYVCHADDHIHEYYDFITSSFMREGSYERSTFTAFLEPVELKVSQ